MEDSYEIQKVLAVCHNLNTSAPIKKELAFRMEKLPSHLVIHKRVNAPDTRLAKMEQPLIHNPLEHNLGIVDFDKYAAAATDQAHAFIKLGDMWQDDIDPNSNSLTIPHKL